MNILTAITTLIVGIAAIVTAVAAIRGIISMKKTITRK